MSSAKFDPMTFSIPFNLSIPCPCPPVDPFERPVCPLPSLAKPPVKLISKSIVKFSNASV